MNGEVPEEQRGRLERVYLERANPHSSIELAVGNLVETGEVIDVKNGAQYVGSECLVRITGKRVRRTPITLAFLVATDTQDVGDGLSPEEYVLYGKWEDDMEREEDLPTRKEIGKYFDPGNPRVIPYFQRESSEGKGRYAINGDSPKQLHMSPEMIVEHILPEPKNGARMMLAESDEGLEAIVAAIKHHGLTPIRMLRLNKKPKEAHATISGRLEVVHLEYDVGNDGAMGEVIRTGMKTVVAKGGPYVGGDCLVRFDGRRPRNDEDLRKSSFLTTHIPKGSEEGIDAKAYTFYALWEERMDQRDDLPTLNDINEFYDPGKMRQTAYIFQTDEGENEARLIHSSAVVPIEFDFNKIVHHYLPNGQGGSPVILAETEELMAKAAREILKQGKWPIRLEALQ